MTDLAPVYERAHNGALTDDDRRALLDLERLRVERARAAGYSLSERPLADLVGQASRRYVERRRQVVADELGRAAADGTSCVSCGHGLDPDEPVFRVDGGREFDGHLVRPGGPAHVACAPSLSERKAIEAGRTRGYRCAGCGRLVYSRSTPRHRTCCERCDRLTDLSDEEGDR